MVNKANMRKWVAALRSGQFDQGTVKLRSANEYCCLGVACEVAIANGVNLKVKLYDEHATYDGETAYLPRQVSDWLGLSQENPLANDWLGISQEDPLIAPSLTAVQANDTLGWSFDQIADAIEEFYKLNDDDGE